MATKYFLGTATAVAQITTMQVTAYDAGTTYSILVNSIVIASTIAQGSVNATATALSTAWNASTHPWATPITASAATDTVTLTADTAGVPYTVTTSESGGAGTIGDPSITTASAGANDWSTALNWSDSAVPAGGDTVILANNSVNICWGLAQSAVTLAELRIEKTYTGKIGLDWKVFATSINGETTVSTKHEYRATYLAVSATLLNVGQHFGPGNPNGSSRIKIDLGSNASTATIFGTAQSPSETGLGAVRLKNVHATSEIHVRSAPGGVSLAGDVPGETSTVSLVSVSDQTTASRVMIGSGVTITTYRQDGGTNVLQAAATVTTVTVNGGTLTMEGDYTVTTGNVNDGTVIDNHIKTAAAAWTTLNHNGGTIDVQQSNRTRTWTTLNLSNKGTLKADGSILTVTTLNDRSGKYTLTAS